MAWAGKIKVAVVGAGIAGLAAAYELKKAGVSVKVFEQSNRPGGRMTTRLTRGLVFDGGADFFSENFLTLKTYAKQLGIEWLGTQKNGRHRVIRGGKAYYLTFASLGDLARFKLLSPISRIRLGLCLVRLMLMRPRFDLFDLSTIPSRYDFDNATNYVSRVAGKEIADYMVDSFTSTMQFHRAEQISTAALFALTQTMVSKETRFALCSTPNGMNEIPKALAKKLNVSFGQKVKSVTPASGGKVTVGLAKGRAELFDAVVIAAPAPRAAELLPKKFSDRQKFLSAVRYASTITVAFAIPDDLFSEKTHLSYVPFIESKLIGGYANEGAKGGRRSYQGKTLLNVYLQEESARKMMAWPKQKIFEKVLIELNKLCPEVSLNRRSISPLAIERWPLAMPKFDHRYISSARKFTSEFQGSHGLYFAGDYLNAPWTEGAARSGLRAAQAIIQERL